MYSDSIFELLHHTSILHFQELITFNNLILNYYTTTVFIWIEAQGIYFL